MNTHQGTGLIKGHKGKHSGEQRGRDVHVEESKLTMLKRNKKKKSVSWSRPWRKYRLKRMYCKQTKV